MGRVTRAQRKATRSVSNSRTRHRKSLVVGTALPLRSIPEGAVVFNVEHRVGDRSVFATDPGDHAVVISHNPGNDTSRIKLSSGAEKTVAGGCSAILKARNYTNKGKRKSRRKGRVVAINPVEQPQGGDNQQQIGRNLSLIAERSNSVQHRMDNWSMFRRDAPPGTNLVLITGPRISRRLRGQATSAAAAVNPNFD